MTTSNANSTFTDVGSELSTATIVPLNPTIERICLTEPVRSWRRDVIDRLDKLVRLDEGWDGYRGRPTSLENAQFALRMLEACCGFDAPAPQIVPGSGGDLQIEWHTRSADIELHVVAPNRVHAWRSISRPEAIEEELELTVDFLAVVDWIQQLVEQPGASATAAA